MVNEVRLKNGTNCTPDKSIKWMAVRKLPVIVGALRMLEDFEVDTLEGTHQGKAGDYLLKGVKGELYPVKKEIFEETYEPVQENELENKHFDIPGATDKGMESIPSAGIHKVWNGR